MIVVADTGPIHYLILIGEIEVLQTLAGQVIIPQAVLQELQAAAAPEPVRSWFSARPA